ncbi:hypothetical protein [Chryseobacterium paridis]|uniref:Mrr-like domain-containing protein n=1 Tax=Chryseobacterium paridis TaxID=2800328 RepID=A0ABS1FS64_9FLAO|nr:hypothetical protein [Chryseobacterium paridis]MBK1895266.1 hypothetical protein [Chryseobacterium paridis]
MKKTLRKPENWQDFESLCKKLWGELWEIPHEIKKNGRLGQPQAGIDVYGVPKGKINYFGIQAKGKDDYTGAKLETNEIQNEIEKAKTFSPALDVFIIATTANKDIKAEQYVREKDIESRSNNGFKILLFCWEDITDLIEENRETFNWYVKEHNFRDKFDVEIFINYFNNKEMIVNPKFENVITKYKHGAKPILAPSWMWEKPLMPFQSNKINHSWCEVEIIIENTGAMVIEDWKLSLQISDNIKTVDDGFDIPWMLSNEVKTHMRDNRTTYAYEDEKLIKYFPVKNSPLIQNDNKWFKFYLKPFSNKDKITIKWTLLARDFNKEGELTIINEPVITDREKVVWVENLSEVQKPTNEIIELITETE